MSLAGLLQSKRVVVVSGSGGVGKTSTAAAMAVAAAQHTDRRVLVMTIDPARRLADALGIDALGNVPSRVALDGALGNAAGELHAVMLDTKQSWDDLVSEHVADDTKRKQILDNPLYRNITERFVQSHDYIAMERLWALHESGDYDLVIIDTPPSAHAADFLDAPERMGDFFESKLLRFLIAPSRNAFTSMTSRSFLALADKLLGKRFLADITEFFVALDSMRPGFVERSRQVNALLQSDESAFVVVTTLEPGPRSDALAFVEQLRARGLALGGVVCNRTLSASLLEQRVARAAASIIEPGRVEAISERLGVDAATLQQVANELSGNFDRFHRLATHERSQLQALAAYAESAVTIPWFEDDLHNLDGLSRSGAMIWNPEKHSE
jgi:anion-transporting  ArsA/GET3 family ATPase